MLTEQMKRTYDLIERGINERGVAPSYREIAAELGFSSLSHVNRMVKCLEERGMVSRIPGKARALALGRDRFPGAQSSDFEMIAALVMIRHFVRERRANKLSAVEAMDRVERCLNGIKLNAR